MSSERNVAEGLEGIVVTRTKTSHVDGQAGRLVVAGRDVEDLALARSFEGAVADLFSAVGVPLTESAARAQLAEGRRLGYLELARRDAGARSRSTSDEPADAMDTLRAELARLPARFAEQPLHVVGATATFVCADARRSMGAAPVEPDVASPHAADFLRMMGLVSSPARATALGAYLVTVLDHGLNASTFAARVVASTGSDLVSAVVAGVGALKGPLHGGAPGPVLDMLDAIGEASRAEAWLAAELDAKRRIMGMGHRIYRVRDPRAAVLERALGQLGASGEDAGRRLALARAVEVAAHGALRARYPDRALAANVEFYTAVLLDALGIPRTHFAATFAAARVAGWCAHVLEQRATGRLIRPDSLYEGAWPKEA